MSNDNATLVSVYQNNINEFYIESKDITSNTPFIPGVNDALVNTSIEIRVYN